MFMQLVLILSDNNAGEENIIAAGITLHTD